MLRLLLVLCCILAANNAFAAKKVALLIGNANYTAGASPLKNPTNDVAAMKATLQAAEFEVHTFNNLTRVGMSKALDTFSEAAADADVGLIFYSGHGMEVAGKNYLIPTDAVLDAEKDVKYEAIVLDDLLESLSRVKTLKLVLLDACRDNPRASGIRTTTRAVPNKGLARFEVDTSNLLVAYATAPGEVAQDGAGANSPFTKALVNHLVQPGVEVEAALRAVAKDVFQSTEGKQRPFKTGSLFETVTLGPAAPLTQQVPASSITDLCVAASIHWQAIHELKNRSLLEEHLGAFGTCPFASLVKLELAGLPPAPALPKPGQSPAVEVASLAPIPALPIDEANLKRLTQAQLKRVGCYAEAADGDWGAKSDKALGWFNDQRKTSFEKASGDALAALRVEPGRVCPIACSVREREVNGQCVAKTCPARQTLNRNGTCVSNVAVNAPPKNPAPKAPSPNKPTPYSYNPYSYSGGDSGGGSGSSGGGSTGR